MTQQKQKEYRIRTFHSRQDLKDAFHIQLNHSDLAAQKLQPGSVCFLKSARESSEPVFGTAWPPTEKLDSGMIQVSSIFWNTHNLNSADRYTLCRSEALVVDAKSVEFAVDGQVGEEPLSDIRLATEREEWATALRTRLRGLKYVTMNMRFRLVFHPTGRKEEELYFKIVRISPVLPPSTIYNYSAQVPVTIMSATSASSLTHESLVLLNSQGIIGLDKQTREIDKILHMLMDNRFPFCARGLLLHGPHGTGKSLIQKSIAEGSCRTFDASIRRISAQSNPIAALHRLFDEAIESQPSVVLLDSLDRWSDNSDRFDNLLNAIERVEDSRVLVIGATLDLKGLTKLLRRVDFFYGPIEIGHPDLPARAKILEATFTKYTATNSIDWQDLARRTRGYAARDLGRVVTEAWQLSQSRGNEHCRAARSSTPPLPNPEPVTTEGRDFDEALKLIKSSALQGIVLQVPNVRWADIGGQDELKADLLAAMEWPLKHPELYTNARPEKGILLYGPPGCSKTMTAKAIATELGLNFLAIKGAELLSKYVGQSEGNIRDLFQKAKAAAPSIIFFDEIDSMGRTTEGANTDLHILTTLLTEIDGFEDLNGVTILAATNNPDALSPALLRPGRFDKLIYVGPPDSKARYEILMSHAGKFTLVSDLSMVDVAEATEGYSGAEVVRVFQVALHHARGDVLKYGAEFILQKEHFQLALGEVKTRLTPEMIEGYMEFKKGLTKRE